MTQFPHDQFIYDLRRLASDYPEYADILEQLIVELEQGKIEKIRYLLEQSSSW